MPRSGRFTPGKETRYRLYIWLSWPQGRSGRVRKISPPIGIRSPYRPASSESLYRLSYPDPQSKRRTDFFFLDCVKYKNAIRQYVCVWYSRQQQKLKTCSFFFCSNQTLGRCGVVIVGYVEKFISLTCLCRCGSEPEVSFHYILLMFPSFPIPYLWHVISNDIIRHMISFSCLVCLRCPLYFV